MNNKIIVILGPTSSGKSDVAIKLAKKFKGEIISADSRQVYRGLDIGSGKVPLDPYPPLGEMSRRDREGKVFWSEGIPHYAIDIISPRTEFNAAKFKKYADKVVADILKRGKLPIICGGTGFWIKALVDNIAYPEVKPDPVLRSMLRNKSTAELFTQLKKLDPARAETIDAKNPVRLIRAIEIAKTLGYVPKLNSGNSTSIMKVELLKYLQIGIKPDKEKLAKRIELRLKKRFASGMIEEVEKLHYKDKISWKRLESFGLGYRLIPQYLKGYIKNKKDLFEQVYLSEKNYAKRQMTWFKKDKRIVWLDNYRKTETEVRKFLKAT